MHRFPLKVSANGSLRKFVFLIIQNFGSAYLHKVKTLNEMRVRLFFWWFICTLSMGLMWLICVRSVIISFKRPTFLTFSMYIYIRPVFVLAKCANCTWWQCKQFFLVCLGDISWISLDLFLSILYLLVAQFWNVVGAISARMPEGSCGRTPSYFPERFNLSWSATEPPPSWTWLLTAHQAEVGMEFSP